MSTNRLMQKREAGFSLIELMVVVAITFVVAAMATPNMVTAYSQYRLKSAASDLANMIQKCRMEAVKNNTTVALHNGTAPGGQQTFYLDKAGGTPNMYDNGEPTLVLPQHVTMVTSGSPGDATSAITPSGTSVNWNPAPAQFNARGLPCADVGGVCRNLNPDTNAYQGYVFYLKGDSSFGPAGWAAVTVTPAGRVHATLYTGSSGGYK